MWVMLLSWSFSFVFSVHDAFQCFADLFSVHEWRFRATQTPYLDCVAHADELDLLTDVRHLQITARNQESSVAVKRDGLYVRHKLAEYLLMCCDPSAHSIRFRDIKQGKVGKRPFASPFFLRRHFAVPCEKWRAERPFL